VAKYHPDHVQKPQPALGFGKEERSMFRIVAAVLLATWLSVTAASARGGGAEPMPAVNFTDMPPYLSGPSRPAEQIKPVRRHVRWRQGSERDR
jgi:hypothetical protein